MPGIDVNSEVDSLQTSNSMLVQMCLMKIFLKKHNSM